MQASEIREMSDADIRTRIAEIEEERFRLKFRGATETLEDPLRLRWLRRDVARLNTVLRERELAAAEKERDSETVARAGGSQSRRDRTSARQKAADKSARKRRSATAGKTAGKTASKRSTAGKR
jgi:large subunit ribosomal protein L29